MTVGLRPARPLHAISRGIDGHDAHVVVEDVPAAEGADGGQQPLGDARAVEVRGERDELLQAVLAELVARGVDGFDQAVGVTEEEVAGIEGAFELGVRWIEVDPFFVFHFLNAYDDGDTVVVEGCRSDRLNVSFGDDIVGDTVRPSLHRWRINPLAGTVSEERLDDRPADFPRINDAFAGLKSRYGYLGHTRSWQEDEVVFDGVTRHDLQEGTSVTHIYGDHSVCGEAVFAPDPDRTEEDAGWLLNIVSDQNSTESALVILDAQEMTEVGRVHLPRRVPFGFHGNWMAQQ